MSTELVAIERINIKKDNGDADALRRCLAHYLQQLLLTLDKSLTDKEHNVYVYRPIEVNGNTFDNTAIMYT